MNCPSDGTTLLMSERQGIEIDYCPQCRGVWLDRGELDKILEKARVESEQLAPPAAPAAPAAPPQAPPAQPYDAPAQPRYDAPRYDRRDDRYDPRRDDRRREGSYDDRGYGDRGYGDQRYGSKSGNPRRKKSPFEFLGDIFEG